jgi:transcriptional antiterminator NusG
MSMRWYVVHAYSGFEKSVQRALLERISSGREWQRRFRSHPRPGGRGGRTEDGPEEHFRAQVLPRLCAGGNGDERRVLASCQEYTEGHRFCRRYRHKPSPISEKEVAKIMQQMQEGVEKPRPKVLFEPGEVVRVKEGPFTDFHGCGRARQLREEPVARFGDDLSVGRRRSNWSSGRSRKPDRGLFRGPSSAARRFW